VNGGKRGGREKKRKKGRDINDSERKQSCHTVARWRAVVELSRISRVVFPMSKRRGGKKKGKKEKNLAVPVDFDILPPF